ncbi:MAG: AgmX/PglI C-terminal domain-containing protein [Deltaproteobacteria bacterium]|nr:AgmX/PglI C-terminal domain-containing protein [Deltaproteobacteria bacterium]
MSEARKGKNGELAVPTGLQALLRLANAEAAFLRTLIERREAAANAAGIRLTRSERGVLRSVPAETLAGMARAMPPAPPAKLPFLRRTAATAVLLLGGAALADAGAGCKRAEEPRPAAEAAAAPAADAAATSDAGSVLDGPPDAVPETTSGGAMEPDTATAAAPDAAGEADDDVGPGEGASDAGEEVAADLADAVARAQDSGITTLLELLDAGESPFGVPDPGRPEISITATVGGLAPDMPAGIGPVAAFALTLGEVEADGALDPEVVRRVLSQHRARFKRCVEEAERQGEDPTGRLQFRLIVDAGGTLVQPSVAQNSTSSSILPECIVPHLKAMAFPAAAGATNVRVTLVIRRNDDGA